MTFLLNIRPHVEKALVAEAQRRGVPPQALLDDVLDDVVARGLFPDSREDAPRPDIAEALAALKGRRVPQSLDELTPRFPTPPETTAIQMMQGQWPGDETEEHLLMQFAAERAKARSRM